MPKYYRGMRADARALATYVKLLRASEGVLRESSRLLALYDLTSSQFGVLEALHQAGPQCLSDLARRILKTSGNLTLVVGNLGKRRLIRRRLSRQDRRFITVALTPKGRNLVRSILPGHAAAIVSVMARLKSREQETLGALCRKLGRNAPSPAS